MSYHITEFNVYQNNKKIKLPVEYAEDIKSGYNPFYYNKTFKDWILEKSKTGKIVISEVGDYGVFICIYEKGKHIKDRSLKSLVSNEFKLKD